MGEVNWGDLTQAANDAGFSLVPNGTYNVTVAKAEAKKTSTGKDQIAVRFTIDDGPNAKASLFNNFVISPDNGTALGFFFRHMKALGLGPDFFSSNPSMDQVAAALVGKKAQAAVSTRIWNEEERNQIDKIMAPLGGQVPSAAVPTGGIPQPSVPVAKAAAPTPAPAPTAAVPAPSIPAPRPAPTSAAGDHGLPPDVPF